MEESIISVTAMESGERLDALLAHSIEGLTRSAAVRIIEQGLVTLNGIPLKKKYRCNAGDIFETLIPDTEEVPLTAQNIPLDIVFEDADVIVVNKARGMVVHPAPGHPDGTLVNALMYHCGESLSGIGGEKRPGIVHRIDKDTSGLLIVAKNDPAHQFLSAQLADRSLSREYEAIVRGNLREDEGVIDKPIGRHPTDRKRMAVTEKNSRNAVTYWKVIERYRGYTRVKCVLETGRTHQIRVHMASIGHPLLGDFTYGAPSPEKGLEGQCLHARRLKFIHPRTKEQIVLETALPQYFEDVLSRLGESIG
ncbi:MAG: RluA family pseudouridine synthase [Eubacteriales bacterium]|nr:RluA family pseudouridine synthase [Eubacteriales bacterium]